MARINGLLLQFGRHLTRPGPVLQPLKLFKPKHPHIPRLSASTGDLVEILALTVLGGGEEAEEQHQPEEDDDVG